MRRRVSVASVVRSNNVEFLTTQYLGWMWIQFTRNKSHVFKSSFIHYLINNFHLVKLFPPPPRPVWCVPVQIENLKWRGPDLQIVREFDMKESRFADLLIENLKSRFWEKLSSETVLLICDDLFLLLSNIVTKSMSNTQLLTTVLPSPKAELHHSPSLSSPSSFLLLGSTWTRKKLSQPNVSAAVIDHAWSNHMFEGYLWAHDRYGDWSAFIEDVTCQIPTVMPGSLSR